MTIGLGWLRTINDCQELILASDSRLNGGPVFDQCPKMQCLPREDCAMCFAGDTIFAYPMMMQAGFSIGEFDNITTRAMPIEDLRGAVLKSINTLNSSISFQNICVGDPNFEMRSETEFIFGGYSWIKKQFKLWQIIFDNHNKRFVCKKIEFEKNGKPCICMIGDREAKNAFASELAQVLRKSYGQPFPNTPSQIANLRNFESFHQWDLEPFDALCNLLKKRNKPSTIGGSPQMVKVYQYMNSKPVGVFWPNLISGSNKNRILLGRKMQSYEKSRYWFIDPDTHISYPGNSVVMVAKNKGQSTYSRFDRALLIKELLTAIHNLYQKKKSEYAIRD